MRRFTKISLVIVAVVAGLTASRSANAERYIVNGHVASVAEAQYLAEHGFADGEWVVDAWGIGPAHSVKTILVSDASAEPGQ